MKNPTTLKLILSRSDTFRENHEIPEDAPEFVEFGPFEYVELTYEWLRVSPDGDILGAFKDGAWWLDGNPHPFSDIAIGPWETK